MATKKNTVSPAPGNENVAFISRHVVARGMAIIDKQQDYSQAETMSCMEQMLAVPDFKLHCGTALKNLADAAVDEPDGKDARQFYVQLLAMRMFRAGYEAAQSAGKIPVVTRSSERDMLLESLRCMCSHEPWAHNPPFPPKIPQLVPNPTAVTRDSGLLALSVRYSHKTPTSQGLKIERGDTIVVDPRLSYGLGEVLLISYGEEVAVAEVRDGNRLFDLQNDEPSDEGDWLVIGKIVELRKSIDLQGRPTH